MYLLTNQVASHVFPLCQQWLQQWQQWLLPTMTTTCSFTMCPSTSSTIQFVCSVKITSFNLHLKKRETCPKFGFTKSTYFPSHSLPSAQRPRWNRQENSCIQDMLWHALCAACLHSCQQKDSFLKYIESPNSSYRKRKNGVLPFSQDLLKF